VIVRPLLAAAVAVALAGAAAAQQSPDPDVRSQLATLRPHCIADAKASRDNGLLSDRTIGAYCSCVADKVSAYLTRITALPTERRPPVGAASAMSAAMAADCESDVLEPARRRAVARLMVERPPPGNPARDAAQHMPSDVVPYLDLNTGQVLLLKRLPQ
jgi:opacity protein-like surface antigen